MRNLILLSWCLAFISLHVSYGNEKLVIFGDSLSDNGNALAATERTIPIPASPYGHTYDQSGKDLGDTFPGRFTDGQNWVDYFPAVARSFGVDVSEVSAFLQDPENGNATNFAVGGATSGEGNAFFPSASGLQAQIPVYLNAVGRHASADDWYVIWIGADDLNSGIDPSQTVANIKTGIAELADNGAKNFVVITIPDLSLTPQVKALGGPAILAAKRFVLTANFLLEVELLPFAFRHGINIELVDINAIFVPLVYTPGRFGFTNSVDAAFIPPNGAVVHDPNDYLFWDGFHPTTNAHQLAAKFIFKSVFSRRQFQTLLSGR
jgi:phospholipase/lecithinase/hemolysin